MTHCAFSYTKRVPEFDRVGLDVNRFFDRSLLRSNDNIHNHICPQCLSKQLRTEDSKPYFVRRESNVARRKDSSMIFRILLIFNNLFGLNLVSSPAATFDFSSFSKSTFPRSDKCSIHFQSGTEPSRSLKHASTVCPT